LNNKYFTLILLYANLLFLLSQSKLSNLTGFSFFWFVSACWMV